MGDESVVETWIIIIIIPPASIPERVTNASAVSLRTVRKIYVQAKRHPEGTFSTCNKGRVETKPNLKLIAATREQLLRKVIIYE
jgi:hypothetical protein